LFRVSLKFARFKEIFPGASKSYRIDGCLELDEKVKRLQIKIAALAANPKIAKCARPLYVSGVGFAVGPEY